MEKLVSVIVPVFNAEEYLEKCISSLLKQTYKNIEVILVDDGSTDNSPAICEKYKNKDFRIKVVHKENSGVSNSRNVGLYNSKGMYVLFVDSDDFLDTRMIEVLVKDIISTNSDISICRYLPIKSTSYSSDINYELKVKTFTNHEAMSELLLSNFITGHLWNKLFKKSLWTNITFDESLIMYEDTDVMYKIFEKAQKVSYNNFVGYFYVIRSDSAMKRYSIKQIDDMFKVYKNRHDYFVNNSLYNEFRKYLNIADIKIIKMIFDYIIIGDFSELLKCERYRILYKTYRKNILTNIIFSIRSQSSLRKKMEMIVLFINKRLYSKIVLYYIKKR